MHDPGVVRFREAVGNLRAQLDGPLHRQRTVIDEIAQRLSFDQFHREIRGVIEAADFVDRNDVRMIESGGSARFLLETFEARRVAGEFFRQNFDRHRTPEARVARAEDFAHAASANSRRDFVGT